MRLCSMVTMNMQAEAAMAPHNVCGVAQAENSASIIDQDQNQVQVGVEHNDANDDNSERQSLQTHLRIVHLHVAGFCCVAMPTLVPIMAWTALPPVLSCLPAPLSVQRITKHGGRHDRRQTMQMSARQLNPNSAWFFPQRQFDFGSNQLQDILDKLPAKMEASERTLAQWVKFSRWGDWRSFHVIVPSDQIHLLPRISAWNESIKYEELWRGHFDLGCRC